MMKTNSTIAAISTGEGGAIAIIRLSGADAITICDKIFSSPSGKKLSSQPGFSLAYGNIISCDQIIDDVIVSVFRAPRSYTGEDMVEISCHGSKYVKQKILNLLIENGACAASAGEFTLRAFISGKLDLAQAEAVADLIASNTKDAHSLAINQIRGGYSAEFRTLRARLLELATLLELELDFSDEDVEFADRKKLTDIISAISARVSTLKESFRLGNVIKNGVPVAIVGSPNVGKSTLLNALLNEERAMVSDIPGTTRDVIEDVVNIGGVEFRFIDTAGIRITDDVLESMGIERTFKRIESATIILLVCDSAESIEAISAKLKALPLNSNQSIALILNKSDKLLPTQVSTLVDELSSQLGVVVFAISAKSSTGIEQIESYLSDFASLSPASDIIVSNARHHEALTNAETALLRAQSALSSSQPTDLLSQDIKEVLHHIAIITGEITTDDILGNIFSKFCIGK